ncbi:MAG TPA: hypothetical protein VG165_05585 [Solirubrobacteraceae bacterium]|jgi:hypothetical protein|nr:hypothetical protein [Solirubrobacteraceae bacterium]
MRADPIRRSATPGRTRWPAWGRARSLAAVAAPVVLCACGSSSVASSGGSGPPARAAAHATATTPVPGSSAITSGPRVGTTAAQAKAGAREFAGRTGAARFRVLVGDVCLAVRAGAPTALGRQPSDAAIRSHVVAASAAAARILTAFVRLQAPAAALDQLRPLKADYQRLGSLYASVLAAGAPAPHAFLGELARQEQKTSAEASLAGVPGCAPATAPGPATHTR